MSAAIIETNAFVGALCLECSRFISVFKTPKIVSIINLFLSIALSVKLKT